MLDPVPPFIYKKTQVANPTRLEASERPMSAPAETDTPAWPFPFSSQDWEDTPPAIQAYIRTLQQDLHQLQQRMATIKARLKRTSKTSNQPPSSDPPYRQRGETTAAAPQRKPGGRPGHRGARQTLFAPTILHHLQPPPCACGSRQVAPSVPYYTHQVVELPPIALEITHFILHQARCRDCGQIVRAQVPPEHATGYGPRFTALIGELAGVPGTSRRLLPHFCGAVLRVPLSLGGIQKRIDRVSDAIGPHYAAIAVQARSARVNYIDETPWLLRSTLHWLWVMVSDTVSLYMVHPKRSTAAFEALIEDWAGMLVSDGYGVYQQWVAQRHTCVAHLMRAARSVAERPEPDLAACGRRTLAELQRLCHMAKAPPSGGAWRAWYARLCQLIQQYHDQQDDAGRLVRRVLREMDSLWVFLGQHGVEPTNNRAERALRFGVLWRKRSLGTASDKGNRWVERILSLRETCRLHARSTYESVVEAVSSLFTGQQPDLAWIGQ
jgi:transposase